MKRVTLAVLILHLLTSGAVQAAEQNMKDVKFECIGSYGEKIQSYEQYTHYVFLRQGYSLRILDIIDPAHPAIILWRRFDTEITSMVLKWPALYIGFKGGAVFIWDVSDPAQPRQIDTLLRRGPGNGTSDQW